MEGWLSIPSKQNIRRHGWRKQYVVVSSKKIFFYNSEGDKQNADPALILDLNKVGHAFHRILFDFVPLKKKSSLTWQKFD